MRSDNFDVTIIGAGPAGATAAIMLAQAGHHVALIDKEKFPRVANATGWVSMRIAALLQEIGVPAENVLNRPFRHVTFFSADFAEQAKPNLPEPVGYLIDRPKFENALIQAATDSGATLIDETTVSEVRLKETAAEAKLSSGEQIDSRLLLLATGRNASLLDRAGFSNTPPIKPMWTAQVESPLAKSEGGVEPRVAIALGLNKAGSFALCAILPDRMAVTINWFGEREEARPAMIEVCKRAAAHGVLPMDLGADAAKATVARSPASQALDLDTHVGKHTLVIGDAGGFVSATSNEGIYPAMASAQVAVETLLEALNSDQSQDELMKFDTVWRMRMADYLRAPHTDIQFLLPLVFSNQPMADRMAAAFFSGENI